MDVPEPNRPMKGLAPDRCLVSLGKGGDFNAHRAALETIVRAWIKQA
jgi:hypothetical protein